MVPWRSGGEGGRLTAAGWTKRQTLGTVLVVDDDVGVRAVLTQFLTAAGYAVRVASSGREALALLGAGLQPDLFVLDLMMPELGGLELIPLLRANPGWAGIPVVVLTGTKGYSATQLQVEAVLLKPFNSVDVQAAVFLARASRREPAA